MAKLLKGLIVVLLIVSVVALVLSFMLFQKREELKGRTQLLERVMAAIGATIEAEDSVVESPLTYPERDIDEVTDEANPRPERAGFWSDFHHELELAAERTVNLSEHSHQLMQYYRLDPVSLKPLRDPQTGRKLITGPGTMHALLGGVITKAEEQLARLNLTRLQLRTTRKELVGTIGELNGRKQELRGALATITDRDATVGNLKAEVSRRDDRIEEYAVQVSGLNDTLHQREYTIAGQKEEIVDLEDQVARLVHRIKVLVGGPTTDLSFRVWDSLSRGLKGQVTAVNDEWNYVVLKLNGEFVTQYASALRKDPTIPQPEFILSRGLDARESFVTKVRLDHVDPVRRLGVASILTDWAQSPVQVGDVVVY